MVGSYRTLKKQYDDFPEATRNYLRKLDMLLADGKNLDAALAYIFMKLEEGHHKALKCGLVRIHDCNSAKVDEALRKQRFTRAYFRTVYKNVFGEAIPSEITGIISIAEKTRDGLIHGKDVKELELRKAISLALSYVFEVGQLVEKKTGKNPYGDLRGLAGRKAPLKKTTSYWVMKGIGLYSQDDGD
ncbi:hypothetical protein [uncultured Roseobacter sp.]|uniref:hypothetical protein n=1 Tax=uncultured Roseobacter sp. TaxID=114847 RepID=UPI00262DDBF4|nr:hypothetical protein [uncultured Roseobacter sp.]